MTTTKKLRKIDRDAQIKAFYINLPPGMRNMRYLAKVFGVSKSTVHYAINGRDHKK